MRDAVLNLAPFWQLGFMFAVIIIAFTAAVAVNDAIERMLRRRAARLAIARRQS